MDDVVTITGQIVVTGEDNVKLNVIISSLLQYACAEMLWVNTYHEPHSITLRKVPPIVRPEQKLHLTQ